MHDRWSDDEQLLAALGEALREADAVPSGVIARGEAAFDWLTIDAELATLTFDSAIDPVYAAEPERVRAETAPLRALRFQAQAAAIVLEVTDDALVGQLLPPGAADVSLLTDAGTAREAAADDLGFFTFRPVPRGSFRLRCRGRTGLELVTSRFQL